ncbi:MAG: hypothetical protein CME70_22150 [Halobacteriovorax sp.]|nr:hypothetical protein [Halobacteriovorax sp.]|tara:strand:+ start:142156 stop:142830 length:675 start_codon:yes stop_codon:yes gene_type:complete
MSNKKLILLLLVFVFGCKSEEEAAALLGGSGEQRVGDGPDSPSDSINYVNVRSPRGTSGKWKEAWSNAVGSAIDEHSRELAMEVTLPSSDLAKLNCPGFNQAKENDKKRFWALFMSSISLYETDFNPNTRYWERGLNLWSEGLFQLSVSTGRYHSGCGHITKDNILDPIGNIRCAVAVMRNQIRKRGSLFPTRAYYWSVLTTSKKYKVQNFFKSQMAGLSFCQL